MRDIVAYNAPAPQAPARNQYNPPSIETYNSHRKIKRPKLGDRKVYRPVRRHTLSRIDETPNQTRPRSKSLQHSTDFSSTRPMMRSRSNVSADTSRSVPICNQSHEIENQIESVSPQYAEPKGYESGSDERPASMMDLPIMVPMDPLTGAYIPYPEYAYYHDDNCRLNRFKRKQSKNNLFLAFMY
ncbi:unnamed protein product, partial [Brenthis ino]